jgi:hypothetical protein
MPIPVADGISFIYEICSGLFFSLLAKFVVFCHSVSFCAKILFFMLCIYRSKANFAENMANNVKKRVKVPASTPKRKQRMVCLMSEEEVRIVDCYLKKYKITNKARWLRETVLTFIHQKMEEDYPTLFNEHDMRR